MKRVRISKEFTFEMAHALFNYQGKCANIHGHSYHLTVTVVGEPQVSSDSNNGMVIDFSELKTLVEREVIGPLDHALVLNDQDSINDLLSKQHLKIVKVKYQPTCENLLVDIATRLTHQVKMPARLHSLKLRETGSCYAEWFSADNT